MNPNNIHAARAKLEEAQRALVEVVLNLDKSGHDFASTTTAIKEVIGDLACASAALKEKV